MQEPEELSGYPDAMKTPFAPVMPIFEQFARKHDLSLSFDTSDIRWGEVRLQLFWLNAYGCSCFLSVVPREPEAFLFRVICWGIHSQLGAKSWEPVPMQHLDSQVIPLLHEALSWSDAFGQQA